MEDQELKSEFFCPNHGWLHHNFEINPPFVLHRSIHLLPMGTQFRSTQGSRRLEKQNLPSKITYIAKIQIYYLLLSTIRIRIWRNYINNMLVKTIASVEAEQITLHALNDLYDGIKIIETSQLVPKSILLYRPK